MNPRIVSTPPCGCKLRVQRRMRVTNPLVKAHVGGRYNGTSNGTSVVANAVPVTVQASITIWADHHRVNKMAAEHQPLATLRRPHRRAIHHTIRDGKPQVLECVDKERCGTPKIEHERARLRHGCLYLTLRAGQTRTLQERVPDPLLHLVGQHAVEQAVKARLHRQLLPRRRDDPRAQLDAPRVSEMVQDVPEVGPVAVDEVRALGVGGEQEPPREHRRKVRVGH
mmetsp:Transcript_9756/g.24111  ORF Transcript_9756/g.24111 Transcript_9756/m.24111 type:complete len:225 (+) Transcript_9756:378-1052(+)